MERKKYLLLFLSLITISIAVQGQYSYSFNYDDGGKAKERYFPVAKSSKSVVIDTTEVENPSENPSEKPFEESLAKSFKENILEADIKIYPNPLTKGINVDLNTSIEGSPLLEVYTLSGIKIYSAQYNGTPLWIDMEKAEAGTYVLKVTTKEHSITQKIIKQ